MTQSTNTVPFKYAGFWDVPRHIVFAWKGHRVLLESWFDDDLDEYEQQYSVYLRPEDFEVDKHPWHESKRRFVGKVDVQSIIFDETKRSWLDPTPLTDLLESRSHG
jgi:hypothetical protein